jgi:hypothetical protein
MTILQCLRNRGSGLFSISFMTIASGLLIFHLFFMYGLFNIVTEQIHVLVRTCIFKELGSSLSRYTSCHDSASSWFCSVPTSKFWDNTSSHRLFLQNSIHVFICQSSYHLALYSLKVLTAS